MKNVLKIMWLLIVLFCFSCQLALAKNSSAPEGVNEIIEAMGELEESYENNQWKEALESTEKIEDEIKAIIAQTQTDDLSLLQAIKNLKDSVIANNSKDTELDYIVLQRRFFSFLNIFDYDIHPVLIILEQYIIEEAGEAAANSDFKEVVSEIREAGNLIKYAKPLLIEKGVTQQEFSKFNANIIALIKTGKSNDTEQMKELLKKIQAQYITFMALVK